MSDAEPPAPEDLSAEEASAMPEATAPWWRRRPDLAIVLALPIHALLLWLLVLVPSAVEAVYGRGLYPLIVRVQSVFDLTPLSPVGVTLVAIFAGVTVWTRRSHRARPAPERTARRLVGGFMWRLLVVTAALGHLFPLAWGLNYWRPALPDRLQLDVTDTEGFATTATEILERTNRARVSWPDDPDLGAYDAPIAAAVDALLRELELGQASLHRRIRFVPPRTMTISSFHGMVNPWTTEGWVDPSTDVRFLPFAIAHEKAHQAGIAREADANLIAFLALARHDDPYLRYSAFFYVADQFKHVVPNKLSADVLRDMGIAVQVRRATQVKAVVKPTRQVYDAYLKANKVEAGIADYGRVALLIHAWLTKHPGWWDR